MKQSNIDLPKNPFGGVDEQAAQEQFEELCGGVSRATQLLRIWERCHSTGMKGCRYYHTKEEVFRNTAHLDGFTDEQIDFFMAL